MKLLLTNGLNKICQAKAYLHILLAIFILTASNPAQSGRTVPTPDDAPEVLQSKEPVNENVICDENTNDVIFIDLTERDEFIKKINRLGACGYKLEHVARILMGGDETFEQIEFTGLVRKDGKNKYEYSWFITKSPGQAQTLANKLAANNFYLKKAMSFALGVCGEKAGKIRKENDKDTTVLGRLANLALGEQWAFFLFERKVGSTRKNEYRVIDAEIPNTNFKENQKKLQDLAEKGFRPVELWYLGFLQYHLLIMEKDESIKPQGEYILDKELYGVSKDLTKYAEKGYKLVIMGMGLSVLSRTSPTPLKIKYHSFMHYKKLQKALPVTLKNATLVETGNDFLIHCDAFEDRWFFTTSESNEKNSPNKEFVFLNTSELKSKFNKDKSLNSAYVKLSEEQTFEFEKQTTEKINQLLKENFEIVNFNFLNGYTVMFERSER